MLKHSASDPMWGELRKSLVSDMSSALDAADCGRLGRRQTSDRHPPFAHTGYKLASRLLRIDRPLIESLARKLVSQYTIDGDALTKWLDANASLLTFDELETSTTY
jgi:hypothetical protein